MVSDETNLIQSLLHDNEIAIDAALVQGLLADQAPDLATARPERVTAFGTDNAMFRLGTDLVVRLPRLPGAARSVAQEQRWLPVFGPQMPVAVPVVVFAGKPGRSYPFPWSVYRWLPGISLADGSDQPLGKIAVDLARAIQALWAIDPTGGPLAGGENSSRGVDLIERDESVRECIAQVTAEFDPDRLTAIWSDACAATRWTDPPVWVHGDLMPGNLLTLDGRLAAIIDWGAMAVGDPAVDLMPAWNLFGAEERQTFRTTINANGALWRRGRGWALSQAVIALPYYRERDPEFADLARRTLNACLTDTV